MDVEFGIYRMRMGKGSISIPILLIFTLLIHVVLSSGNIIYNSCPCDNFGQCNPVVSQFKKGPQVYVFSKGTSNVHLWKWNAIDTLIVPTSFNKSDPLHVDTMCTAHTQNKRFGITVEFTADAEKPGYINMTHGQVEAWRMHAYLRQKEWHADLITVDLLPYFRDDQVSTHTDHLALATVLYGLKQETKKEHIEILCVVPWIPPCAKADGSCHFATYARDGCDFFLLNPDSFLDKDGTKCIARANIPMTKLLYSLSEYTAHHIPPDRILLGVTWHGYDYTCKTLEQNVCGLLDPPATETDTTSANVSQTCDYRDRKRVSYGDIVNDYSDHYMKHEQDDMAKAPFFNYKVDSENHQIWFEDHGSLQYKYDLATDLDLRGVAILYGDDLSASQNPNVLNNEGFMWSWLTHEMMLHQASKPKKNSDLHWADTIAGVAVGCFLVGALLGVIFTCISMQKRVKKPRAPFQGDMDPLGAEYVDDPEL